jgi:hypothetical protein
MQSDQLSTDRRWITHAAQAVEERRGRNHGVAGDDDGQPAPDLKMKVGDIIPLDIPETVVALVDDVPLMECRYGQQGGQYALKVDRFMAAENSGNLWEKAMANEKTISASSATDDAGLDDDWAAAMAEQAMAEAAPAAQRAARQHLPELR